MKKIIFTSLLLTLLLTACYKDSGEIKSISDLGPVYPDIQLEPEWIYSFEPDVFHFPWFMLETGEFVIYYYQGNLHAIHKHNGEPAWVFYPEQHAYPALNLSPLLHLFEYQGYLYYVTQYDANLLKINLQEGTLAEVIELPARGPNKDVPLESFFHEGRFILHRM